MKTITIAILAALLSACGGGSGADDEPDMAVTTPCAQHAERCK